MLKILKYSVGLDVSKDDIHACVSSINEQQLVKVKSSRKFTNHLSGFKEMETWMNKHREQDVGLTILMEATGVYYEQVALFFSQGGYAVSVVVPNKAKKYLQAIGIKTKNDKIDAAGLSRMGAEQQMEVWQPMGDFFYRLRQLTRHYQQLQESKTQFNNQLHALEHSAWTAKEVVAHLKKMIALLDKQAKQTSQIIDTHISSNEEVRAGVDNICKIKGVSLMTIATVIAETNGFALFKNIRQLVSYSGYDVIENQSGKHTGKTKISKKGNSHIRRILHLPAFNVVRYDQQPFAPLFNRVYERTGIKMKGYVAVQKKLLVLIYTLWKKNEPYEIKSSEASSNEEPKPLFLPGSIGAIMEGEQKEIVPINTGTTQDELPCNESPEALFLRV